MTFSEWLSQQMEQRCETNYRLAKDLEVSQTTVAHWRSGVAVPHLSAIRSLSERYGADRTQLVALRDEAIRRKKVHTNGTAANP